MKFSIITPVFNGEKYLAETIESVLSQEGDFEIEYIIADGGSTDGSVDIIKSYEQRLNDSQYPVHCKKITFKWFSKKDDGMYDAIEKGFSYADGDIYAYINSDDKYLPAAFDFISKVFSSYPKIKWLKGISRLSNQDGTILSEGSCYIYRQQWIKEGIYGLSAPFIQQESVFWRKSLWIQARTPLGKFRLAGDYALWVSFANRSPLWSLNKPVSIFRRRPGQLSSSMKEYREEQEKLASSSYFLRKRAVLFFSLRRLLKLDPRGIIAKVLFFILFPLCHQEWYIDFNTNNEPVEKIASSYVI